MPDIAEKIATDLAALVKGDIFCDIVHRVAFASDASIYRVVPACVVAPRDAEDVAAVVKYAAEQKIAICARGAGTGLAGESLCSGIIFDMPRYMNKIISIEDDGRRVICQPGVVLDDLNKALAEYGRKIGPDPSSANRAVIGGCVANNATGAHSLEYGYIADYVESIEAVLADGSIVEFKNDFDPQQAQNEKTALIAKKCLDILSGKDQVIKNALPRSKRNRCGYNIAGICHDGRIDFVKMLAGSEGTLAIFTKIILRTVEVPEAKALLQLEFDSLDKMAKAVPIVVDSGAATCELMDKSLIGMAAEALPQYKDILPTEAEAVLLIEHNGQTSEQVKAKIENTVSQVGALAYGQKIVFDPQEQARLSKSRKDAVPLLNRKRGKKRPVAFIEDVTVDNNSLGEYISGLQAIAEKYDIAMSFYGHAGDGELHVRPYLDLSDPAEVEKMRSIADEVFSLVWSLGGSISGEHADGLVRTAYIKQQYGEEYYQLLREIKNVFDPEGLMNPGKIVSDDADVMVKNLRAAKQFVPERLKTELLFAEDEFQLELGQCNGCGICLSREPDLRICPVFRALGEELASSRAKANLLHWWATGQLDEKDFESADFKKILDLCVHCKMCSVQCPSGVDISRLISAVRAEYVKRKGLGLTELMLSRNRYLSIIGSIFSPVSGFVMSLQPFKWLLEKAGGLDKRRDMPAFDKGSFLGEGRQYLASQEPIEEPIDKVAYFMDSYANYNDHKLALAVLKTLHHNNIEVILPDQRPAPLPAIVYGDIKTARKDLGYNVEHLAKAVRDGYRIVCSEPSAALCLQQELKDFVDGEDAKLVSDNTFELMGYLLDLFKQSKLKPIENPVYRRFVYHCPCHLLAIDSSKSSIELLKELAGVEVVDIGAGCCGLAGTFGMQKKNYDLSEQISTSLAEALQASKIKYVLTECSACKMQIEHMGDCFASHPIKILAQAYGIDY